MATKAQKAAAEAALKAQQAEAAKATPAPEQKPVEVNGEVFETDLAKIRSNQHKLYDGLAKAKETEPKPQRKGWLPPAFVVGSKPPSEAPVAPAEPTKPAEPAAGDPCPCGSGGAYIECHGKPAPAVSNGWVAQG